MLNRIELKKWLVLITVVPFLLGAAVQTGRFLEGLFAEKGNSETVYSIAGNKFTLRPLVNEMNVALSLANMGTNIAGLSKEYRDQFVEKYVLRRSIQDMLVHDAKKSNLFEEKQMKILLKIFIRQAVYSYYQIKMHNNYKVSGKAIEEFYNRHKERLARYPYSQVLAMIKRQLLVKHRQSAMSNFINKISKQYDLKTVMTDISTRAAGITN